MTATQLSLMDQPLHALEATIRTSLARRTDPATSHEAPTRQALNVGIVGDRLAGHDMRGVVILAVALALLSSAWMAFDASGRQGGIRVAVPFIAFNMLLAAGLVVWRVAS